MDQRPACWCGPSADTGASPHSDRLVHGNPGAHRNLTEGVSELKIKFGLGYRVYYTTRGDRLMLLLVGGYKSSQVDDIAVALQLARNFQEHLRRAPVRREHVLRAQ